MDRELQKRALKKSGSEVYCFIADRNAVPADSGYGARIWV